MIISVLIFIATIIVLWISAEFVVKHAQEIAEKLKISETFLGLTLLSIGTSLPELGTHIVTSIKILRDNVDISGVAVGTNVGSNIIQITVILGLTAFFMKIKAKKSFLVKDYVVMLLSILMVWIISTDGISRQDGFILIAFYAVYLWTLGSKEKLVGKIEANTKHHVGLNFLFLFIGLIFLLGSSEFAVRNLVKIADALNLTDSLVGALILGVGTALPELAASIAALTKKSSDMSLGVLIGSNITNPLLILGIGAAISSYTVDRSLLFFDIPFWFFASLTILLFMKKKRTLVKWQTLTMMAMYVCYVVIRIMFFNV